MVDKVLLGTIENDPEWINELVSFLINTKDKNVIEKYKSLFRDLYLDYLREGMQPKVAIEKAKLYLADDSCLNILDKGEVHIRTDNGLWKRQEVRHVPNLKWN